MASELLRKIRDIQREKGMSDREMANKLGCSRQLYEKARNEKIPLRHKILQGASVAFPELQPDILIFLSRSANRLSNKDNENDNHSKV